MTESYILSPLEVKEAISDYVRNKKKLSAVEYATDVSLHADKDDRTSVTVVTATCIVRPIVGQR